MKSKIFSGLIIVGAASIVTLQCSKNNPVSNIPTSDNESVWVQQNPYPTSNSLFAVEYITDNEVWAAGSAGTLLHSRDGGHTWNAAPDFPGTVGDLYFVDSRKGWAVGSGGMILYTDNGGATWRNQFSGTKSNLQAVYFLNSEQGWVVGVGGVVLRTQNGGKTWNAGQVEHIYTFTDVLFIDDKRGWAIGTALNTPTGAGLVASEDGGKTWKEVDAGIPDDLGYEYYSAVAVKLYALARSGTNRVTVVGEAMQGDLVGGIRVFTDNAGATWNYAFTDVPHADVAFIDSLDGWIVGYGGTMFHSLNGGTTWTRQANPGGYTFQAVAFSHASTGCAVGEAGSIYVTSDRGVSWTKITQGNRSPLEDIYFSDTSHGWAAGYDGLLRTEDGGKTWFKTGSNANQSISFINDTIGYAGTFQGDVDKSIDGGITWTRIAQNISSRVYDVHFYDTLVGWTCGNESIRKTTDGGKTWYTKWLTNREYLWALTFVGEQYGWSVGGGGTILHTVNGGETWNQQVTNTNAVFEDVLFVDSLTGWAVGSAGTIVATHDGGTTWEFQSEPGSFANAALFSVTFTDHLTGWVVGAHGLVLHTTDGGQTWVQQPTPTANDLWGVFALDQSTGWACGWNGTVLHTTTSARY